MVDLVFGKGDRIGIPRRTTSNGPGSGGISYTKPHRCGRYSRYGFEYPLNSEETPLHIVLDDQLPPTGSVIKRHAVDLVYLVVDHYARVWMVMLTDLDGTMKHSQILIDHDDPAGGWWTTYGRSTDVSPGRDILTGLLRTDPSDEKLDEYFTKYHVGETIRWLSISEIVKTLNEKFPKEKADDSTA